MALLRPLSSLPSPSGRYYPQQKDPRLNEDLRLVYQMAYDAHDRADQLHSQLREAHKKLDEAHSKLATMQARPEPGGPSTTKIAGLYVIGQPPSDADRLTYDASSGQIVWKP